MLSLYKLDGHNAFTSNRRHKSEGGTNIFVHFNIPVNQMTTCNTTNGAFNITSVQVGNTRQQKFIVCVYVASRALYADIKKCATS